MGTRFYDSYLGRWLSADTIVPDPANPQSLNRYSWVLGNPLRYIDPTGHVEEGKEAERATWIIEMLQLYGILIEIDFGWISILHPALGASVSAWDKGAWELNTLEAVLQGVEAMASAIGGQDAFRQALPKGIKFERRAQSKYGSLPRKGETEPGGEIIRLFDAGVGDATVPRISGIRSTVVHELAHAWDQQSGGALSKGLEEATWGYTERDGTYHAGPSDRPWDAVITSRGEDWAYSSEAMIYGFRMNLSRLDNLRYRYVAQAYPGAERPVTWNAPGR